VLKTKKKGFEIALKADFGRDDKILNLCLRYRSPNFYARLIANTFKRKRFRSFSS